MTSVTASTELEQEIHAVEARALAHFANEPTVTITVPIPPNVSREGMLVAVMNLYGELEALATPLVDRGR